MCFDLMQEEARIKYHCLRMQLGILEKYTPLLSAIQSNNQCDLYQICFLCTAPVNHYVSYLKLHA